MTIRALELQNVNTAHATIPELRMNEGLWLTFSALLDGPATARALSDRLQRPLVIVVRDLTKLKQNGLITEAGSETFNGFLERRYQLPDGNVMLHDAFALPVMLRQVECGFRKAQQLDLLHGAGLVAVRVTPQVAQNVMRQAHRLREELEAANQSEGIRFNFMTAAYAEEPTEDIV